MENTKRAFGTTEIEETPRTREEAVRLRPDGVLVLGGAADADGRAALALAGAAAGPDDPPALRWVRRTAGDHLRRLVSAADGGPLPGAAALAACRPDALETLGVLSSVPPMPGGEYWTPDALAAFFGRVESAFAALAADHGGDALAAAQSLGPGWRDVGKVSLHLAENKGDKSGSRPFAFLATFVGRADEGGRARHLPLSAALKAFAGRPAALSRILAPLEAAAKSDAFLLSMLESRRIFQPCALTIGEAHSFLKGIAGYREAGLLVRTGRLWAKEPARAKVTVSVGAAKKGGVLSARSLCCFDATVTVGGEPLSEEEIRLLLGSREGLVRLRGEWVEADPEKIAALLARWQEAKRLARDGLPMAKALRLLAGGSPDSLASGGAGADGAAEVRATGELRDLLRALADPAAAGPPPPLPDGLDAVLRPYQKAGVEYLRRTTAAGLGACLADDMGLGKTLQVLALVDLWRERGEISPLPVLIVMPASLLSNWRAEAARFAPSLRVGAIHPSDPDFRAASAGFARDPGPWLRRFDLALTTYGQFARLPALRALPFAAVIADEAQAIKNPGSAQSRAMRAVASPRRLALTGTPVENRLSDLWSLFDFLDPGLLGPLDSFRKAAAATADFSVVRRLTRPFILRRLKTDKSIVPDLPDKTEVDVSTPLSHKQALLYGRTVEDLRRALDGAAGAGSAMKRRGLVLAYLMRFKQICDHPALFLGTGSFAPEDSGKFMVLRERASEIAERQEKMLVFTQYREMTEPLSEFLSGVFGREGLVLHGGTPVAARGRLVAAFQDPAGPPFFVLSVKAAGTGLNLTAASHVVHFDRWWNPAVENQASDRAYRIGQKRNVLVHKFVSPGTLEERIDAMIKEKQGIADALFADGGEKLLTEMSDEELVRLVSLSDGAVADEAGKG